MAKNLALKVGIDYLNIALHITFNDQSNAYSIECRHCCPVSPSRCFTEVACLPEMTKLLDCLARNDEREHECRPEIADFHKCSHVYAVNVSLMHQLV